jgi:hypothetical protein
MSFPRKTDASFVVIYFHVYVRWYNEFTIVMTSICSISEFSEAYLWNISRKYNWIQQTTNPLIGSDASKPLLWFGQMDQKNWRNSFTTSAALHTPSNEQWVKAIVLFCSWESCARKYYGKLLIRVVIITSKFNHSHHVETVTVIASPVESIS